MKLTSPNLEIFLIQIMMGVAGVGIILMLKDPTAVALVLCFCAWMLSEMGWDLQ
jgi:hypothetical protein